MKARKLFLAVGLVVAVAIGISAGQAMAGWEGQPPIAGEKIIGPEMWGVVIIDTTSNAATMRVKKIEDCAVDTDPQKAALSSAPGSEADVLFIRLQASSVFGLPCTPIITQVKNWKDDTLDNLISFDCQIKFVVPETYTGTTCTE